MVVTVRLFAGLRERAGRDRVEVELPDGAVVSDLLAAMDVAPRSCVVAINREYADERAPVRAGDEVALVPPVSGGAGVVRSVRVTGEPLDLAGARRGGARPGGGRGRAVRGRHARGPELDYEAYAEMAEERLRAIGEEVAAAYGCSAVALEHRTGTVPLGEPSVIVAASAPHRGEAFNGARALIDRVKAEAPIWKVEVDAAGGRTRVEGTLRRLMRGA